MSNPKKPTRTEVEKLLRYILKWENKQPTEAIINDIEAACEQTIKHRDELTLKHIFDQFSIFCPEASEEKGNFLRAIQSGNIEGVLLSLINDVQEYLIAFLNTLPDNEQQNETPQLDTGLPIYRSIDLANRTIIIGNTTYFIKGDDLWEYLKELCSTAKQGTFVPYLEGAKIYKNQNDQLRKLIKKDNHRKFIFSVKGYGFKLNPDVKILESSQVGIRKTRASRNRQ